MSEPFWITGRSSSRSSRLTGNIRRRRRQVFEYCTILVLAVVSAHLLSILPTTSAFSMSSSSPSSPSSKQPSIPENSGDGKRKTNNNNNKNNKGELYGIPNSGWTNPQWNWGYARGTGHDCAAICRTRYQTRASRETLVQQLLLNHEEPPTTNIEEVKLVLALAWQKGRWDGSDGGRGGYGDVLAYMAQAERYEPLYRNKSKRNKMYVTSV
jgi:hypothetical protein